VTSSSGNGSDSFHISQADDQSGWIRHSKETQKVVQEFVSKPKTLEAGSFVHYARTVVYHN